MRPIRRGHSPRMGDYADYAEARPDLVRRLGTYCSYCERPVLTMLAVEHIEPKGGPNGRPEIEGRWDNFLLACVNCNSTKGDTSVSLAHVLLPDRDNTFAAMVYTPDGKVVPSSAPALATLQLVGLHTRSGGDMDANGRRVALDRTSQRMEAWLVAAESRAEVDADPESPRLRAQVVRTAVATGFFSIWMTVFAEDADMRRRLVEAFPGTCQSGCFGPDAAPVTPAPNPDGLPFGGKA